METKTTEKVTYHTIQLEVEAFRITKETRESNADWPEWLHRAWNKEPGTEGSLSAFKSNVTIGDDPMLVFTVQENDYYFVMYGDWIVRILEGDKEILRVLGHEIFKHLFLKRTLTTLEFE